MLPMLLMILLLALEHTSEGIEYHVKPTDPEVTQCPVQPCHTLAEYLENSTWDNTSHARVVFMPGHHRVAQSFRVRYAFNLTLLGSTRVNHTLHDTRPILHISTIWFHKIINLNLTGIIVIKSYELEQAFSNSALKFANIFNLRVSQIALHSTRVGITIDNVFGNSVIEQSSFKYGLAQISILSIYCPLSVDKSVCAIIQSLHVHLSYHHKISIRDCIFESGSTSMHVALNSFPLEIDISNIVTHGKQQKQISLIASSKTPYMVRIRDSLLESNGIGIGILISSYSFSANQKIQISNCTLAGHTTGIEIIVDSQHKNNQIVVTHAAPEIEIKRTTIRDNSLKMSDQRGIGLMVSCGDKYSQPSIMLKNVLFTSTVNRRLSAILPSVVYMEFAQNVSFVDCSFTGNRGTPIVAISSHFNVSGRITFVNNTVRVVLLHFMMIAS